MKKKILYILLCLILLLSLTGCNSNQKEESSSNDESEVVEENKTELTEDEKAQELFEQFAKYIDEGNMEKAAELLDFEAKVSLYGNTTTEEIPKTAESEKKLFISIDEVTSYKINKVERLTDEKGKEIITKIYEDADNAEKYWKEFVEKYSDYDLYYVDYTLVIGDETINPDNLYYDIYFYNDGIMIPSYMWDTFITAQAFYEYFSENE